ncbi:hypothetical protein KP509_11G026100 [Ceratopteris richardii]|nr:hypothetical protein KP509_11G026100 [Ceratopteris richardii]
MKLLYTAEKAILSASCGTYLSGFAMPHNPPTEMHKHCYHMISGAVDVAIFRDAVIADVKANKDVVKR